MRLLSDLWNHLDLDINVVGDSTLIKQLYHYFPLCRYAFQRKLQVRPSVGSKGRQALDIKNIPIHQLTFHVLDMRYVCLDIPIMFSISWILMPTFSLQILNLKRYLEEFPCLGMTVIKSKYINILQLPSNEISPFSYRRPQKQDHPWQEEALWFWTKAGF